MLTFRKTALSLCVAAGLTSGAWAQTDAADHEQHHPDQTQTKPASKASAPKVTQKKVTPAPATSPAVAPALMAKMDKHIQAMRSLHEKVLAAKTPEERQALMAEHAQLMRDCMSMMHQMGGGMGMGMSQSQGKGSAGSGMMSGNMMGMGAQTNGGTSAMPDMSQRQQMMEKRMDMMESMMQMMMGRLPPAP